MNRLEQLKEFLKNEPDDAFLQYAIAMELKGLGEVQEAMDRLNNLLTHKPEYTASYYHLGKLYQKQGDFTKAEEIFREGIRRTTLNKEQHQLAELQTALNNMLFGESDDDE